jgi:hypothetical protein
MPEVTTDSLRAHPWRPRRPMNWSGTVALCHAWTSSRIVITRIVSCQMATARSSKAMRSRWRAGASVAMS